MSGAQLSHNSRVVIADALRRAAKNLRQSRRCAALHELDALHAVFADPPASERVARRSAVVATRRLDAIEKRLLRRVSTRCALRGRKGSVGPFANAVADQSQSPPPLPYQQADREAQEPRIPKGPRRPGRAKVIELTPDTPVPDASIASARSASRLTSPVAFAAGPTDPMKVLTNTEFEGGQALPFDASAAFRSPVAILTGNTFIAVSTDSGKTFSKIATTSLFAPADRSVDAGYCCDQDVIYDPTSDLFIAVIMTACTGTASTPCPPGDAGETDTQLNGRLTLLVADPDVLVSKGITSWRYGSLTGSSVAGPGTNFDQPSLSLSASSLYLTANSFRPNYPGKLGASGSEVIRIGLKALRKAYDVGGTAGRIAWWVPTMGGVRVTQDSGTTAYFWGIQSTSSIATYPIAESSTVSGELISIPVKNWEGPFSSFAPNKRDWNQEALNPLASSVLVGKRIYLAFGHGRPTGTSSPAAEPAIRIVQLGASSLSLLSDTDYVVPGFAAGFPYLAAGLGGDVAMSFVYGGNGEYPASAVALVNGTLHMARLGVSTWANGQRRGDYYRVRRAYPDPDLFTAGMYREIVPTASAAVHNIAEWALFGRGTGPTVLAPDLAVASVSKCGFSVKNLGAVATGPFVTHVAMNYKGKTLNWDFKTDELLPFQTKSYAYALSDGLVDIVADTDSKHTVAESNEANNTGAYSGPPCIT